MALRTRLPRAACTKRYNRLRTLVASRARAARCRRQRRGCCFWWYVGASPQLPLQRLTDCDPCKLQDYAVKQQDKQHGRQRRRKNASENAALRGAPGWQGQRHSQHGRGRAEREGRRRKPAWRTRKLARPRRWRVPRRNRRWA